VKQNVILCSVYLELFVSSFYNNALLAALEHEITVKNMQQRAPPSLL